MNIHFRFTDVGFFEEFDEEFDDNMTLKEVKTFIEGYSYQTLKSYIHKSPEYSKEEQNELLGKYTENGKCRWTIEEEF
jgi:hypothetical protein